MGRKNKNYDKQGLLGRFARNLFSNDEDRALRGLAKARFLRLDGKEQDPEEIIDLSHVGELNVVKFRKEGMYERRNAMVKNDRFAPTQKSALEGAGKSGLFHSSKKHRIHFNDSPPTVPFVTGPFSFNHAGCDQSYDGSKASHTASLTASSFNTMPSTDTSDGWNKIPHSFSNPQTFKLTHESLPSNPHKLTQSNLATIASQAAESADLAFGFTESGIENWNPRSKFHQFTIDEERESTVIFPVGFAEDGTLNEIDDDDEETHPSFIPEKCQIPNSAKSSVGKLKGKIIGASYYSNDEEPRTRLASYLEESQKPKTTMSSPGLVNGNKRDGKGHVEPSPSRIKPSSPVSQSSNPKIIITRPRGTPSKSTSATKLKATPTRRNKETPEASRARALLPSVPFEAIVNGVSMVAPTRQDSDFPSIFPGDVARSITFQDESQFIEATWMATTTPAIVKAIQPGAARSRGESAGRITSLETALRDGRVRTSISAEFPTESMESNSAEVTSPFWQYSETHGEAINFRATADKFESPVPSNSARTFPALVDPSHDSSQNSFPMLRTPPRSTYHDQGLRVMSQPRPARQLNSAYEAKPPNSANRANLHSDRPLSPTKSERDTRTNLYERLCPSNDTTTSGSSDVIHSQAPHRLSSEKETPISTNFFGSPVQTTIRNAPSSESRRDSRRALNPLNGWNHLDSSSSTTLTQKHTAGNKLGPFGANSANGWVGMDGKNNHGIHITGHHGRENEVLEQHPIEHSLSDEFQDGLTSTEQDDFFPTSHSWDAPKFSPKLFSPRERSDHEDDDCDSDASPLSPAADLDLTGAANRRISQNYEAPIGIKARPAFAQYSIGSRPRGTSIGSNSHQSTSSKNRRLRSNQPTDQDDASHETSGKESSSGSYAKPTGLPNNAIMASMLFRTRHNIDSDVVDAKLKAKELENYRQSTGRGDVPTSIHADPDAYSCVSSFSEDTNIWRKRSNDLLEYFSASRNGQPRLGQPRNGPDSKRPIDDKDLFEA
jgi:hypothetical protein